MNAQWRQPIRQMVVLIEHADGTRSAWAVHAGTVQITRIFDEPWQPGMGPPGSWPLNTSAHARLTAEGRFEGLFVPGDVWRDSGFTAGEIAEQPALPAPRREMDP